jgi:hypothetical protein
MPRMKLLISYRGTTTPGMNRRGDAVRRPYRRGVVRARGAGAVGARRPRLAQSEALGAGGITSPRVAALRSAPAGACVSCNDFTGHEVGARRRLALLSTRSTSAGARGRTVATQVLRRRPAHRQGIQRKGRIHSPQPGEGGFGEPPRRLAMVKLQRIRRPERRGIRQPTDGLIVDWVRMPSDPRVRI